ncbi:MAG: cation:proton antiporter [Patescibacteria group bacterium]
MTHELTTFVLQLAIILLVAKLFGTIFEKLGQSSVLGELLAGMAIGPYALGAVKLPWLGAIFPLINQAGEHASAIPISPELYMFGQLGAVVLLFLVGLETDAKMFMRYGLKSMGIALGGVIIPFFLGAWGTVMFGFADGIFDIPALFMGAIMTATSVGITARVLSDIYKLDTDEGVSILAAAVIDDVLGILILAFVISLAGSSGGGGGVDWGALGIIAVKAVGFLAVVTALGILFAKKLSSFLLKLKGKTYIAVAAAICFLIAALAEKFGLAMIIGAYLAGILMSVTVAGREIEERLAHFADIIVPVFFVVMGMLVDFKAMGSVLVFGLVITIFAIIGKVLGSGLPALFSGFNFLGSLRIGFGMLPRGEVALIVAGIGLAAGLVTQEVFGVSIMMTIVTTLMAPLILVPLFKKDKSGLRKPVEGLDRPTLEPLVNWQAPIHLLEEFRERLVRDLENNGYGRLAAGARGGIVEMQHGSETEKFITLRLENSTFNIDTSIHAKKEVSYLIKQVNESISQRVNALTVESAS